MSSVKSRKPAHQNKIAFYHNKGSKKTARILGLPNQGLCRRCSDKIEWRKKYRKYKPLKGLMLCQNCKGRKVRRAYHVLCDDCAKSLAVCGKCRSPEEIVQDILTEEDIQKMRQEEENKIEFMKERERRTYLRKKYRKEKEDAEAEEEGEGEEGEEEGEPKSEEANDQEAQMQLEIDTEECSCDHGDTTEEIKSA